MTHSLLLCGLLTHICMIIIRLQAYFRLVMASLIHFRVTPEKRLESACNVLIWGDLLLAFGLYDGIGAVGARVSPGRFTLVESDFILLKPLSNLRTQYASFLISNEPIGGGMFPFKK